MIYYNQYTLVVWGCTFIKGDLKKLAPTQNLLRVKQSEIKYFNSTYLIWI